MAVKSKPKIGNLYSVEFNFPVGNLMNEVVFMPKGMGNIDGFQCKETFEVRVITRFGTSMIMTHRKPNQTNALRFIKQVLKQANGSI